MSNNTQSTSLNTGGFFLSLLTVLFIGLKLTGEIDWSWWYVLAPIWGPLLLKILVIFFRRLEAAANR